MTQSGRPKTAPNKGVVAALSALTAIAYVCYMISASYLRYVASRVPDPQRGLVYQDKISEDLTVYLTQNQFLWFSPLAYLAITAAGVQLLSSYLSWKLDERTRSERAGRGVKHIAGANLGNEVLEQLRRMGSNIHRHHCFDFFLYLPSEPAAQLASERIRESEFSSEVVHSISGNGWLCKATITILPDVRQLDEIGKFFEQLAAALDGEFEGWESDVVNHEKTHR